MSRKDCLILCQVEVDELKEPCVNDPSWILREQYCVC
jgi:hypothetical protein